MISLSKFTESIHVKIDFNDSSLLPLLSSITQMKVLRITSPTSLVVEYRSTIVTLQAGMYLVMHGTDISFLTSQQYDHLYGPVLSK